MSLRWHSLGFCSVCIVIMCLFRLVTMYNSWLHWLQGELAANCVTGDCNGAFCFGCICLDFVQLSVICFSTYKWRCTIPSHTGCKEVRLSWVCMASNCVAGDCNGACHLPPILTKVTKTGWQNEAKWDQQSIFILISKHWHWIDHWNESKYKY